MSFQSTIGHLKLKQTNVKLTVWVHWKLNIKHLYKHKLIVMICNAKQTMFVPVEAGQVKVQEEINLRSSVTSGVEVRKLYHTISNEMSCHIYLMKNNSRHKLN